MELYRDTLREARYKHFRNEITSITHKMFRLPRLLFVTNRTYGYYAMKEATSLMIPVVSVLNSDTSPD